MKTLATLGSVVVLLALVSPAGAQPKDPAELLSADTLAYLELREPAQVSRELHALIKGSDLENIPATMARFRQKLPPGASVWRLEEVGVFGLMLSPEMLAEACRIQGAAVAVTGFSNDGEPEVVGIVLAGESHGPTFVLRAYLTMDNVGLAGEADGVALYRARRFGARAIGAPGAPAPPPAVPQEYGPTYALLPGVVLIGSTPESVKQVIARIKGKGKGPTLAEDAAFRAAGKLRQRPGLYGYANVAALCARLEELVKRARPPDVGTAVWAELVTGNAKAFRTAAGSLTLHNGAMDLLAHVSLDPRHQSPVLDVLPDRKVDLDVLHAVPKDSLFAATISLPEGEKRWQKLLDLADSLARKLGAGDSSPSKQVEAVEGMLGLKFGKDVFARIAGATFAILPPTPGAKQPEPAVIVIVEAVDADAAKALEDVVPKLVGLTSGGEAPAPTAERIQGHRVRSLPGEGLPWRSALHYGHAGRRLVLGQERKVVARVLTDSGKKNGLLGEPAVATAVKELDEPFAVAVWPVVKTFLYFMPVRAGATFNQVQPALPVQPASSVPRKEASRKPSGLVRAVPQGRGAAAPDAADADFLLAQGPVPAAPGRPDGEGKAVRDLIKAIDGLPPLVIGLTRKPDRLILHMHQADLRPSAAGTINALIEASFQRISGQGGRAFGVGGPVPPPPRPTPLH